MCHIEARIARDRILSVIGGLGEGRDMYQDVSQENVKCKGNPQAQIWESCENAIAKTAFCRYP